MVLHKHRIGLGLIRNFKFIGNSGRGDTLTLNSTTGSADFTGSISASNFSGSSSGTNTGDQTLPTLSSLGALSTSAAASTYLPLAGGNVTGNIVIDQLGDSGAISYVYSGGTYVPKPNGASYATTGNAHTGAIAIKLPTASWGTSDMISFNVDIFDYAGGSVGESVSLYVYGYQYSAGNWTNCGAVILSDRTDKDYTVRFGHDGTRHIVYIGKQLLLGIIFKLLLEISRLDIVLI